jgi:phosphoglycolate phosphatase-like HAD superfamily hydrolase
MNNKNLNYLNAIRLKKILGNKQVFIFDWDGTILDSMKIKSGNFGSAFCSTFFRGCEKEYADIVSGYYLQLSGYPRKFIFVQIMAMMGIKEELESFRHFNDTFEMLNKASLAHADLFPDAVALLDELIGRGCLIFISSSVPPRELADLVTATLPAPAREGIAAVLGSSEGHTKGKQHLNTIMQQTGLPQFRLLVLGDDYADHELSAEAGTECIIVDRSGSLNRQGIKKVGDLIQIKDGLPK